MESTCNGLLFVHVLCGAMCSSCYVCYRYAIIILEFDVLCVIDDYVRMDNHFIQYLTYNGYTVFVSTFAVHFCNVQNCRMVGITL